MDFLANVLDRILFLGHEIFPAMLGQPRDAAQPVGIKLFALVFLQEDLARHLVAFSQPQQATFQRDQAAVDIIQLLHQRLDTCRVQGQ